MSRPDVTRRTAVVTGAAALALVATPALAPGALALLDPDLGADELRAARAALSTARPRLLEQDLVVQWRRDLAARIVRSGAAVAYVRWDKAMILAGLAREAGLKVRQTRLARGLFRVELS